ncbi:ABC transporter ATP-binding protein [Cohnella thermotolerans]|uniref:ABC transporter ATP-binding protein n=1 Tax=Cohnella thermotolerans TaxID=329858 RepID=UPI00040C170D|nr:ABC transporter ATP-binding protein [Cohnella thermotolerans]
MTLILKSIKKEYKGRLIFENVNLVTDRDGVTIAINGKSGIGKTTLLNILAGIEKQTSGTYQFNGLVIDTKSLNELGRFRSSIVGYIPQTSPMIPKLTVRENICVPLWYQKNISKEFVNQKIVELSHLFEISHLLNEKIERLSGGERQRVGLVRAFLKKSELIVADEPTAALDDETALKVFDYFNLLKKDGITIIIATHSSLIAGQCDITYTLTKSGLIGV